MVRLPRVFLLFWASDRGLSFLNLFLVALLFLPVSGAPSGFLRRFVLDTLFILVLLAGIAVVFEARGPRILFTVIGLAQLASQVLRHAAGGTALETLNLVSTFLVLGLLGVVVLARVFREGPIDLHRIQGAVAVYMMLGVMWACLYQAIQVNLPGAFSIDGLPSTGGARNETLVYFSFVTLTTVGFGDVTPVHPLARSLAMTEALAGQLFPTILIARLVAMSITSRREDPPPGPPA